MHEVYIDRLDAKFIYVHTYVHTIFLFDNIVNFQKQIHIQFLKLRYI